MKRYLLPIAITVSAAAISLSAAFYSVSGLSKLFAGAGIAVSVNRFTYFWRIFKDRSQVRPVRGPRLRVLAPIEN